mmetsp:Transcript_20399/g.33156  ORF Transcript_20399/g.33156 Transcript_20399/m.33156 type:complete len:235 (-) Transcript_20399:167-871(-)
MYWMKSLNLSIESSPSSTTPTEDTELSCSCSWSKFRNSSSFAITRSKVKLAISVILVRSTREYFVSIILVDALIPLMRLLTFFTCSASTRSTLFSRTTSANATCSTASFSPCFSSSSRCRIHLQSTTVIIASMRKLLFTLSSAKNVCATGAGSAMPVVSIITPSSDFPFSIIADILWRVLTRSPRTVQQMQPLFISMISSSSLNLLRISASSTPTAPNSFSITAYFFSFCSRRM